MQHKTNTSQFKLLDEGEYFFTVAGVPEKRRTKDGKGEFFIWKFDYYTDQKRTFRTVLLPSQMNELLLILGGVETEPDVIEWDDEKVVGKSFMCNVIHEEGSDGKTRERIVDIKGDTQPPKPSGEIDPKDIAWDE